MPQPIELKQLEASQSNLEDDADLDLTLVDDESQLVKEKSAIQNNLDIIPKSIIVNTETQNTTKSGKKKNIDLDLFYNSTISN